MQVIFIFGFEGETSMYPSLEMFYLRSISTTSYFAATIAGIYNFVVTLRSRNNGFQAEIIVDRADGSGLVSPSLKSKAIVQNLKSRQDVIFPL